MQAAAIIVTLIALYATLYSLCWVAAESEAKTDRYRTRTARARNNMPPVWRMRASGNVVRMEVARGR